MANNLNLCQFIGNLGNDPDQRFLPDGTAVVNISIACNWKGKDTEGTEWVRIAAFGRLAEIMGEYLRKGSKVYVAGKMRTRSYDKDGITRYATEIVADRMEMLDTKGGDSGGQRAQQQAEAYGYAGNSAAPNQTAQQPPAGAGHLNQPGDPGPQPDEFSDDIDF